MANSGDVLKKFYDAVQKRNIAEARQYLDKELLFIGLFETYRSADEYLAALTGLLQVTVSSLIQFEHRCIVGLNYTD
jgi:hypothetical protein